jgi:biotin carboxyl carrier protein
MKISIEQPVGTVTLRAPATGVVRWLPPESLCGELDVFAQADPIAAVAGALVLAPAHGFIVRLLVRDGEIVEQGSDVCLFGIA